MAIEFEKEDTEKPDKKYIIMDIVGTMGGEEIGDAYIVVAKTDREALRKYMKATTKDSAAGKEIVEGCVKDAKEIGGGLILGDDYGLFIAEVTKEIG